MKQQTFIAEGGKRQEPDGLPHAAAYLDKEKELKRVFESKYGPLTLNSPVQTNNWLWDNSPWPWEVQK